MKKLKPEKGRLLISAPMLTDVFRKSVVYLTEHNEQGSVGFIINKPIFYKLQELIDNFPHFEAPVFFGGPVQPEMVNFIHRVPSQLSEGIQVKDNIYWGGNFEHLKELVSKNELNSADFKFFLGYAGWAPGQLEDELKFNSWIIAEATEDYLFNSDPKNLWHLILKNMGGHYAIISTFPDDPSVN
ncbi:MAG: YqgE/AlgH family protein [Ignavibacteria bacterium]